ncbi:hypothetical protein Tco_1139261, partial [Tanacetum coccineum]
DNRYAEWCDISSSSNVSYQESNKARPRDYTFREWTLVKDDSATINYPIHRSFHDYKWEFNLEIDKLADEYELGIGENEHILDNIWEYYLDDVLPLGRKNISKFKEMIRKEVENNKTENGHESNLKTRIQQLGGIYRDWLDS